MNYIKSLFKKMKWETLITALMSIIVGILFLVEPENSSNVLCTVVGVAFVLLGAAMLVRYFASGFLFGSIHLIASIILLAIGIFSLLKPETFKIIITFVFGLFLMIDGLLKIQDGMDCYRANVKGWWALFLVSVLSIVLGSLVMFGSFDNIMIFAGISLIVGGVLDIITTLVFSSHVRKVEKRVHEVIEEYRNEE